MKINKSDLKNKKILIIGDLILDEYLFGDVERISPEAPVPILNVKETDKRLGGAANVALNCSSLGCKVDIISVTGDDKNGDVLINKLSKNNITCFIEKNNKYKTIKKTRVISNSQQILRIDDEKEPPQLTNKTISIFRERIETSDIIIFSDYGKGILKKLPDLIKIAKEHTKICLVDPKGPDIKKFKGTDILTPNMREIKILMGSNYNKKNFKKNIFEMMEKNKICNIVLTKGREGISLFQLKDKQEFKIEGRPSEVYDVTGAGDTVISVLSVLLSINYSLKNSCTIANKAGGIIVQKFGTSTITFEEIF